MAKIKGLKYHGGRTRDKIVTYLSKYPGSNVKEIAAGVNIIPDNVQASLYNMNKAGLLTRWRTGQSFAYMLRDAKPKDVEDPELELLKARLVELELFKAQAVEKHPDLAIDYEAYRPALEALYKVCWNLEASDPLDDYDKRYIDGIIAAAKVLPR